MDDIAGPVSDLVALLVGADIQASTDPADLNVPAAWVNLDSIDVVNVAGDLELRCRVFLIAPDTSPLRAMEILADLYTRVRQVLSPDGPVVTQGVVMPGDPTPLPALSVPVNLYTS